MITVTFACINDKGHHAGKVYTSCVTLLGRKDNLDIFTPTRQLVYGHKYAHGDARFKDYKPVTDEEYTERYAALLKSKGAKIRAWLDALNEDVTITCFCPRGKFCHRRILARWVKAYRRDLNVVLY